MVKYSIACLVHVNAVQMLSAAHDPEQGLAKVRCQDADCERLIGVNVYGSGADR